MKRMAQTGIKRTRYFIIRGNDCQYQQGTPRGALAPFYGNRDVKVEAGLRDRITFGLNDLRYLARRGKNRSKITFSLLRGIRVEYVFLTTFQCDTSLNG